MKILKMLSLLLVSGQLPVASFGQELPPIIDMHLHSDAPLDLPAGAPAPCLLHPCNGKGHASATSSENLEKTLETMDRYNIVKGFLNDLDLEQLQEWTD
jgi:hypothetical protein